MPVHQRTVPRLWLMTDERLGEGLWSAIGRLPDGESGIVVRHYATPAAQRAALAREIQKMCRSRGLVLAIAGDCSLAQEVGADFVHNPEGSCPLPFSASVHSTDEALAARDSRAALVFVSPVFATRSHPGGPSLGVSDATRIALTAGMPAIALGGMNEAAFAALPPGAFHGWAGIDAWAGEVA